MISEEAIVRAAQSAQQDRAHLLALLSDVLDSVLGEAPDGAAIAYLSQPLLDAIRCRTSAGEES